MSIEIRLLPVLNDNYIFILHDAACNCTAVVDPALPEPVLDVLKQQGWGLDLILCTHHHGDHTGGTLALKQATGAKVIGARNDAARIPGLDIAVGDGDRFEFGSETVEVLEVPGHTSGHVAYWLAGSGAVFCGDTLFALGCGRMFEGTPQQFWHSLSRLRALPDATRVYCAHEYTASNARFALAIEPGNDALITRADQVMSARERSEPTVPSTIALEKATNPFLRADLPALAQAMDKVGAPPWQIFAELRARKDRF